MKKASNKPLEWICKYQTTVGTTGTKVNDKINLGLRDDEIAEIWQIDSTISHDQLPDAADETLDVYTALSTDPDFDDANLAGDILEDLEIFFQHFYAMEGLQAAAGATMTKDGDCKMQRHNPPVLVGTNVGAVLQKGTSTASLAVYWHCRLFFTRRKATVAELNHILLKRR